MAMVWDDKYSTGVARVDQQHQRLFELVNKVEEQIGKGADQQSMQHILTYILTYTRTHFTYEEFCFTKYRCPASERNIQAHDAFIQAVEGFRDEFKKNGPSQELLQRIYSTAEQWLMAHICKVDTKLRPCVPDADLL